MRFKKALKTFALFFLFQVVIEKSHAVKSCKNYLNHITHPIISSYMTDPPGSYGRGFSRSDYMDQLLLVDLPKLSGDGSMKDHILSLLKDKALPQQNHSEFEKRGLLTEGGGRLCGHTCALYIIQAGAKKAGLDAVVEDIAKSPGNMMELINEVAQHNSPRDYRYGIDAAAQVKALKAILGNILKIENVRTDFSDTTSFSKAKITWRDFEIPKNRLTSFSVMMPEGKHAILGIGYDQTTQTLTYIDPAFAGGVYKANIFLGKDGIFYLYLDSKKIHSGVGAITGFNKVTF
jgi:hypothetical protein